ncbi:methyltransferase domain-containing protein [Aliifodinibius sp. S!AR15-10]|uniref:class I SAM-dependent methyltransferase n=1 Tax=Aliifodinibius sp. S!AR15-10 TaxID=2950437 RepID=UPI00285B983F|nr:methyltransferase domain-containing protein [Aliifodinibius sp. S!AR15-10]MDR8390506.1 methyltransferase domain-containing protein [Aliifodinibius sp. S!AR15-10]
MTNQHYDESFGRKAPENYEQFFVPAIGRPLAEDIIREAALTPGEKVLDVACGTGIVARLAAEKVTPNGTVSGLDVNPGMLAVARSIAPDDAVIDWYQASAEAMPLSDEIFDVVICQLSLQFIENKVVALQEMQRVLTPGGRILLNVPGPISELFTIMATEMEQNISTKAAGFVKQVFSLHDTGEIDQLMSNAGFEEIKIQPEIKSLKLPSPEEFLWQYVHSTPMAAVVSEADEKSQSALEYAVTKEWSKFAQNGSMTYKQRIVTVSAKKVET